jgi:hypothetical protein
MHRIVIGEVVMQVTTLKPTVVAENAAKPAAVLRTFLAYVHAVVQPKPLRATRRETHVIAPRTSAHKELRPTGPCVMLVESDIKKDLHGIMP